MVRSAHLFPVLVLTSAGCTALLGGFDFEGEPTSSMGGSGGGTCQACQGEADCSALVTECSSATCVSGCCKVTPLAEGTVLANQTPGDCKEQQCDGNGAAKAIALPSDTPPAKDTCHQGACVELEPEQEAVDGTCGTNGDMVCASPGTAQEGTCVECNTAAECDSGMGCSMHKCVPPTCTDEMKDGDETDVDCGGPLCAACVPGQACALQIDCAPGYCKSGVCAAPSCTDGVLDGDETDVDCGGKCTSKCDDGKACVQANDCKHGICEAGACVSCVDGKKNGSETDVDCGGAACGACGFGLTCSDDAGCATGHCLGGICNALTLVSGGVGMSALALNDSHLYWTENGTSGGPSTIGKLKRIPLQGGAPETLASNLSSPGFLRIDNTNAYWASYYGPGVLSVPLAGGTITTVLSGEDPTDFAIKDGLIYWTSYDGGVRVKPLSGGTASTVVSGTTPSGAIRFDTLGVIFWTAYDGSVNRVHPGMPSGATTIATGISTTTLAVDSSHAYVGSITMAKILRIPKTGGQAADVAVGLDSIQALAVDETRVFFATRGPGAGTGRIMKAPLDGSTPATTLASGLDDPWSIALSATAVYWIDEGTGTIKASNK